LLYVATITLGTRSEWLPPNVRRGKANMTIEGRGVTGVGSGVDRDTPESMG